VFRVPKKLWKVNAFRNEQPESKSAASVLLSMPIEQIAA
jgi:hypothetical protein